MTTLLNATAYAISTMTSIHSEGITDTGNTIIQILNDTQSMQVLYKYFKESNFFEFYEEMCERNQTCYYYHIPVEVWSSITGLVPEWFFRVTMEDGTLFYDCYFDSDFKDRDSPGRYIYLSLNQKPPMQLKEDIVRLLRETQSAKELIAFFKANELFDKWNTEEYSDEYVYQIPVNIWEETTDLSREQVDLLPFVLDGVVYLDRYFDRDYREYDSPKRYVYVSLYK